MIRGGNPPCQWKGPFFFAKESPRIRPQDGRKLVFCGRFWQSDHAMTASPEQLARTTHLAIGAHPDDLEFMAYHGIATCYQSPSHWFTGIVCCDGAGSVQGAQPDCDLVATRSREQLEAARIGQYNAIIQLAHSSSAARAESFATLVDQLADLLHQCRPEVLYLHNPADSHPTHLSVFAASLQAVRRMPAAERPTSCYGCEVWRDLDWLPARYRVALDVSPHPDLARQLNECFASQVSGGKNYPEAVEGRRRGHATFQQSHAADGPTHLTYALDLAPILRDDALSLRDFMARILGEFESEILRGIDS